MRSLKEFEEAVENSHHRLLEITLNSEHKVKKAEGLVLDINGKPIPVHWDGFGICYIRKTIRYKRGDLTFK